MRDSTDRLLAHAQRAGVLREDISAHDVLRLVHGITIATETSPGDADRLLALVLDGLRPQEQSHDQDHPERTGALPEPNA
jgi:hypothetical protein